MQRVQLFRTVTFASFAFSAAVALVACGPSVSGSDDDDDDDGSGGDVDAGSGSGSGNCTPTAEVCDNLADDDCDGRYDCDDTDCATQAGCSNANCGTLESPEASLALPDDGTTAFTSSLNFTGFSAGQTLPDVSKILGVCVTMEHSWIRDLQMEVACPTGQNVILNMFLGQTGGQVYLGVPNDSDGTNPVPGTGYDYCWAPNAVNPPMLEYANANPLTGTLPAGDYRPSSPMDTLVGCVLNGNWTIKVFDKWPIDNGFIFKWWIKFDASLVEDCASWPD